MIDELVRSTGATDAFEAIRLKARELTSLFVATFGDPETPIDVDVLASLRGIQRSSEPPVLSEDAELVPDGVGGVQMRVNADRPETRQRFSVAHEISHTFSQSTHRNPGAALTRDIEIVRTQKNSLKCCATWVQPNCFFRYRGLEVTQQR